VTAEAGGGLKAQVGSASWEREITLVLGAPIATQGPDVPLREPELTGAGSGFVADRLPMPGGDSGEPSGFIAISRGTEEGATVGTEYGPADMLTVTGPPSGKGGLPITVGGGNGSVVVKSVQPGSLVAGAGLRAGDRILTIDGAPVKSPAQARQAIEGRIGTVVMLEVFHDGEVVNVVVQRVRVH
jgi:membrane-associated protease RseP (regulator of RpoE activity)